MMKTVMKEAPPQNTWIIDPWANIACPAGEYCDRLEARFAIWTSQTKRIRFMNDETDKESWEAPSGDTYWTATVKSGINYVPAEGCFCDHLCL